MTVDVPDWAAETARALPYPLVFATVSGAHLYGFASVDSDLDLRAAHLLPAAEVVGLRTGPDTIQRDGLRDGVELDVVSHDLLKFARLLNSRNGYVLEQLLSPLVVVTGPLHAALKALAPGLITSGHAHHYLGFAAGQEKLFARTGELKPALYLLRVLLTGIHLMRTGEIEANLVHLNDEARLPQVPEPRFISFDGDGLVEGLPDATRKLRRRFLGEGDDDGRIRIGSTGCEELDHAGDH